MKNLKLMQPIALFLIIILKLCFLIVNTFNKGFSNY